MNYCVEFHLNFDLFMCRTCGCADFFQSKTPDCLPRNNPWRPSRRKNFPPSSAWICRSSTQHDLPQSSFYARSLVNRIVALRLRQNSQIHKSTSAARMWQIIPLFLRTPEPCYSCTAGLWWWLRDWARRLSTLSRRTRIVGETHIFRVWCGVQKVVLICEKGSLCFFICREDLGWSRLRSLCQEYWWRHLETYMWCSWNFQQS